MNKNESDHSDSLESTVGRVTSLFTAPTPGIAPDLALGYPFLLTIAFLFLPISSAALLLSFFAAFSYAGRKLVLEDYLEEQNDVSTPEGDDETDFLDLPPTDLLALGSSILCTALVAPDTANSSALLDLDQISTVGVVLILLAIVSTFLVLGAVGAQPAETTTPEKQLMGIWDEQLAKQTQEKTQKEE